MPSEAERALLGTSYSQNTLRLFKVAIFGVLGFIVASIILTVVYGVGEYKGAFIIVAISDAILLICTCFLMYWMEKGRLEDPVKFLTIAQAIAMVVLSASMIAVIYGPVAPDTYALGGTASPSGANGVVLTNSDGQSVRLGGGGCYSWLFPNEVDSGASYSIRITSSDQNYDCALQGQTSGTVTANTLPVTLSCTQKPVTWILGGTVTGLAQNGKTPLVISDGKEDLPISNTGSGNTTPFQFVVQFNDKETYTVTFKTQPDPQTCLFQSGSTGTAGPDSINAVQILCA